MAWTQELPNGNHRAFWRDSGGAIRSATYDREAAKAGKGKRPFTNPSAAMTYGIGREAVARDNAPRSDGRGLTWSQWYERWTGELRRVEARTAKADAGRVRLYLMPKWGRVRLRAITHSQVQAWVNDLAARPDLSASTVCKIHYLLSASLKAAVKDGKLSGNPCALVTLPTPNPGAEHFLTRAEVEMVLDNIADPTVRAAVLMLAYTGLRFSELAGLHWNRVDLTERVVTVAETWDGELGAIRGYPKSKKPRYVPLTDRLVIMLANQPVDTGSCGIAHSKDSICKASLVFPGPGGKPLDYANFRNREWLPALDLAGLPHARIHDLRHSFASWLAQAGEPLHVIQGLLGHKTITTTERYSHWGAEQYERVRSALH